MCVYGSCMYVLLEGRKNLEEMGEEILGGFYVVEVDYLLCYEWVINVVDILWWCFKFGLYFFKGSEVVLDVWLVVCGG